MTNPELLGLLIVHLVLLALPGVAATLLAARLGATRIPVLLGLGMAATGAGAMLAFWLYYADPVAGKIWGYVLVLGSAAALAATLWRWRPPRELALGLATPLALWALGTLFLVFLGFLHGGGESGIVMSGTRFSGQLASDNDIPHYFAEWFFFNGHHGNVPLYPPDWLSSDRPPLQIGYVLTQRGFGWDPIPSFNYQLLCVGLQQLWIVGLWALLSAARVGRVTRGIAMITILASDVAIVNGFFVWPKMLPAAMVLAAAALVLTPIWDEGRRDWRLGALVGALLALAMLGHGSSIFAVIPIAIVAAVRGIPSWTWLGAAVAVALVFYAPWSAYQKYGDPPGNHLNKWMLAGRTGVSGEFPSVTRETPDGLTDLTARYEDEGTLKAIRTGYGEVGLGGALHLKAENFVEMAGGGPAVTQLREAVEAIGNGKPGLAVAHVRSVLFFNLLPSLGLLLLAPLIMFAFRRRPKHAPAEWRLSLVLYFLFAVGAVSWGLILFGREPSRAVIHAGTYVIPVVGLVAGVLGLRALFPRFGTWYSLIAASLMLFLYVPSLTPPAGSSYSAAAAILAMVGLAGFCVLAVWPAVRLPEPAASPSAAGA